MVEPEMTGAMTMAGAAAPEESRAPERLAMSEAEFRGFYERTARPLKAYLSRVTGNTALAEDLLQESYYRMLRAGLPAMDAGQWKSYLYKTATNLARDHFRARKWEAGPLEERTAGAAPEAGAAMSADVQKVFGEMTPGERQMMWLAYVEGASHREIAAVTGVKEASIRPMLYRARQKLAGILRERGLGR